MWNNKLDPKKAEGQHIPLTCKNHPEKRWSTKNIGQHNPETGQLSLARSLFYNLFHDPEMGPECPCPISDLRVVD